MDLPSLAAALEGSAFGIWMRGGWAYPVVNIMHLIGLALLVGPILLLDLRLLGYGSRFPADAVSRALAPFAVCGLLLAIVSGAALFAADATALVCNRMLLLKLSAIAVQIASALGFHLLFSKRLADWDASPPLAGKALALLSILLWFGVVAAGRLIAYV